MESFPIHKGIVTVRFQSIPNKS